MACLVVLALAALASGPLASRAPLVSIGIGVGISIAALLSMRALRNRFRHDAEFRRSIDEAATERERRRIARDLHDGLAQDLAFIVAHGDRLAAEKGPEHPLAIAARRALAVSRGAIAELSAPQASTVSDALRQVADELAGRFGIPIAVHADAAPAAPIAPSDREHIVRIAREAIVNAATHGRAGNVLVSLVFDHGKLILRVRDDGVGIGAAPKRTGGGFGTLHMRERTMSLGGRLTTRAPAEGGTEVELVVPVSSFPTPPARRRAA